MNGVVKVEPGYSGGTVSNPTYEQVCTGKTGHAEVAQITFDPKVISFKGLLRVFFTIHDPTTLNRQGDDIGTQYRSVIFYHDVDQRQIAEQIMAETEAEKIWNGRILTEVTPFEAFYGAEDYHQKYFKRNPGQPYCQVVIAPKVAKFRKHYFNLLKSH